MKMCPLRFHVNLFEGRRNEVESLAKADLGSAIEEVRLGGCPRLPGSRLSAKILSRQLASLIFLLSTSCRA